MCFYNDDCDWYAAVTDESVRTVEGKIRCNECGELIPIGETYHHTFQQESEECQRCDNGECYCVPEDESCEECKCSSPDFGETADFDCCENCHLFLEAVEATEKEAGCPADERRPLLGGMIDAICEMHQDEARKYFETAETLHPSLKESGYLDRLWRKMFREPIELEGVT